MKRILAIILVVSLALGCGLTALASDTQTLLSEDFSAGVLPDGWTVEGISTYYETWNVSYGDALSGYVAHCAQNWLLNAAQDERLILPQTDLTDGATLTFRYAATYAEVVNGRMSFTVKASTDGASWDVLWDVRDEMESISSENAPENVTGTARVVIPAAYCTAQTRLAFVFESETRRNGFAEVDDVVLMRGGNAPDPTPTEPEPTYPDPTEPEPTEPILPDPATGTYADGVYRGTAPGRNADVTVDVTVQGGKIVAIEIVEQRESDSFWEMALEIIGRLLGLSDEESIRETDTVTGATISSTAIRNAVLNALEQARIEDSGLFDAGEGTRERPYIIRTVEQLMDFANSVNEGESYQGKYVALDANLDVSGQAWVPAGTITLEADTPFSGNFDGRNHTVTGLTCGSSADPAQWLAVGFFGKLGEGARVENLKVSVNKIYCYQTKADYDMGVGAIAGVVGENAVIDHCTATGSDTAISVLATYESSYSTGGIAGRMESGSVIANCASNIGLSTGSMMLQAATDICTGGIVGYSAPNTLVANSASFGLTAVTVVTGNLYVGGLIGATDGVIYNCYSVSSVRGNDTIDANTTEAGLLLGCAYDTAAVYHCFYAGDANMVVDFSDQAGDPEEGKTERRVPVGYDAQELIYADVTYVTAMNQADMYNASFAASMNDGRKNTTKNEASAFFAQVLDREVAGFEDVLEDGFQRWDLTGGYVLPAGLCFHENTGVRNAATATCTENGYTGDVYCSDCGEQLGTGETIPALGHQWDGGEVTTVPTATTDGVMTYTCDRCGETRTEPVPATGVCDGGDDCPSGKFVDVDPNQWYHNAIDFAVTNHIFSGVDDTHFSPNGKTTRAMFVAVLWRLDGRPESDAPNPFVDVKSEDYYADAVMWAAENKIVAGADATHFNPNGNVTREQVAAFLYRYSRAKGYDLTATADLSTFPDAGDVEAYAEINLAWAVGSGLISGNKVSTTGIVYLDPKGNATRAQVAQILMKFTQNIAK